MYNLSAQLAVVAQNTIIALSNHREPETLRSLFPMRREYISVPRWTL